MRLLVKVGSPWLGTMWGEPHPAIKSTPRLFASQTLRLDLCPRSPSLRDLYEFLDDDVRLHLRDYSK